MARLSIRLLGPFQVTLDREPVSGFISDKARALLAYLAIETGRPHRRESLAGLLWPDVPESTARTSLRTALANVRHLIGDPEAASPFLPVTRQTIQSNLSSGTLVDVLQFIHLLEEGFSLDMVGPADALAIQRLEEAIALYQGGFLEGFSLADSTLFEEWALLTREQLQRQALTALHRLAAHYESSGKPLRALQHAWRAVDLDPWPGRGQRQVMRLLALCGRREAALAQYTTYRQVLCQELQVEPSEATTELYELLSRGEWPTNGSVPDVILERRIVPAGPCPYRGLAAFREEDAPFFFGREGFVDRLVESVKERSAVTAVVGPSGCGKSSTVFAGLLPRLRAEGGWLIVGFRPGSRPLRAQAAALLPFLELDAAGQGGEVTLEQAVGHVLEDSRGASRLLLVVDQFEELYTLSPDPRVRRRFLDELLAAVEGHDSPGPQRGRFGVLLTLRADFMGQALAHRPFADALQDASLLLGPMTRKELRAAIERPALKRGVLFETGLVERILDDVGQEPGNLPLLEFALTLLWGEESYGWLTHAAYERIGRVKGALARYADEVYKALGESERESARRVLAQLVQPGEGTEDTRRVATRAELGQENWAVVQHLADQRLVVMDRDPAGGETAELLHEALIQGWEQFRAWMEADRAFRTWQERLRVGLRAWEAADRDEGALLRGAPLAEAEGWLAERGRELSDGEKAFIQAAVALRDHRAAEREAHRQRELDAARKLAETERARAEAEKQRAQEQSRSARRLRRRAVFLGGALIVAGVLAIVAFLLGRQATRERAAAQEQARLATARELAAAAISNLDVDIERSILLALEAVDVSRSVGQNALPEAVSALHQAVNTSRLMLTLPHGNSAAYNLDGTRLATCGDDNEAKVWDLGAREVRHTLVGHSDDVLDVAFSPDGSRLATTSIDRTARVWNAESGEELLTLPGHDHALFRLAFSPDGARLAATSLVDGTAIVWDVATGEELLTLEGHYSDVYAVAFSPDGEHLVTGGWDFTAKVWDAETGDELFDLYSGENWVTAVAFSPDGSRLATALQTVGVVIWSWGESLADQAGRQELTMHVHSGFVESLAFSPDGTQLATGNSEGTLQVWDSASGRELIRQAAHVQSIHGVAFSPDGTHVASSSNDGTTKVWDLAPQGSRECRTLSGYSVPNVAFSPDGHLFAATSWSEARTTLIDADSGEALLHLSHPEPVFNVAFSPDGQRLAVTLFDGTATVWELRWSEDALSVQELSRAHHSEAPLWELAFSPDGSRYATASDDGTAKIWDAAGGDELLTLRGHTSYLNAVAYSPDGRSVATAAYDGTARIWDTSSGQETLTLVGHTRSGMAEAPALNDVTYSPDGTRLATAGWDGTARIWDVTSGELLLTLSGHSGWLMGLKYSPDGRSLATTSNDGTARLWDVETGEELCTLTGHTQAVLDVAFSPDGRLLATSSWDGTLRFYVLPVDELMELARTRVTRSLTPEECQQFLHLDQCP
ncbi:MAG: BTAD domain-containing putative transcriptional regulator [Anaerolineae bacterium]|jgi:WD40 repeat protein/DNA-binding SARP family transcriptional activator